MEGAIESLMAMNMDVWVLSMYTQIFISQTG